MKTSPLALQIPQSLRDVAGGLGFGEEVTEQVRGLDRNGCRVVERGKNVNPPRELPDHAHGYHVLHVEGDHGHPNPCSSSCPPM